MNLWPSTLPGWVALMASLVAFYVFMGRHMASLMAAHAERERLIEDRPAPDQDWHRDELAAWDAEFARRERGNGT